MKSLFWVSSLFAMIISSVAVAESSQKVGEFRVHYNALSSDFLSPKVASNYGVLRSKNRGLLNVSVVRDDGSFKGAEAKLEVHATNLNGQLRELKMRKVADQDAVYYISQFPVSDQETLDFNIQVTTLDQARSNIKFRQQFFVD